MFSDEVKKSAELARLTADLRSAKVELLSAQCAVDRLRMQYPIPYIVSSGDALTLEQALASAKAIRRFFEEVELQLKSSERK